MKRIVRPTIWGICMVCLAYLLGVEWTWRIGVLCVLSPLVDAVVYTDYSAAHRIWKGAATK